MSRRGNVGPAFSLFAFQDIITSVTGIMILVTLVLALELIQRVESSPLHRTQQVVRSIQATEETVEQVQATIKRQQARIAELQQSLQQGQARIGAAARFDRRAVESDLSNVRQINSQIEEGLNRLDADLMSVNSQRRDVEEKAKERSIDAERIQQMLEDVEKKKKALEELKKSNRVIFNPTEGDSKTPWLIEVTADVITVAKIGVSAPPTRIPVTPKFEAFVSWAGQRNKATEYFVLLVKPSGSEIFQQLKFALQQMGFDVGYDLLNADQAAIDPLKGAAAE